MYLLECPLVNFWPFLGVDAAEECSNMHQVTISDQGAPGRIFNVKLDSRDPKRDSFQG